MEAGVIEGRLPEQATGQELEAPEKLERATTALSPLGDAAPVAGGVTVAASLALCQAVGLYDIGAADVGDITLGAGAAVALTFRRVVQSRDHLHDRMRWSTEVSERSEVVDRTAAGVHLAARTAWFVAKWAAFVVGVSAILYLIDSDIDPWPLLFSGIVLGSTGGHFLKARMVRRYEAEHDVELFLDADRDEDEDERPAGDPGPMSRRQRP